MNILSHCGETDLQVTISNQGCLFILDIEVSRILEWTRSKVKSILSIGIWSGDEKGVFQVLTSPDGRTNLDFLLVRFLINRTGTVLDVCAIF